MRAALSGENTEAVLILMNNSPVTSACLHRSPQRLAQVSDGAAPPSQRNSVRGGSSEKPDTRCLKNVTLALKNCSSLDG